MDDPTASRRVSTGNQEVSCSSPSEGSCPPLNPMECAQDITDFITAAQSAGLAPTTINTKLSILTSFFEHLREEGQMTHQPVLRRRHRLLTPTVLPKPIPDTDLIAFFQVIDSVRDRLIFLLMLRCGLRVSEVCALAWDAIDLSAGTVRITRGKGQVDRIVYFSPDVTQALQVWRND